MEDLRFKWEGTVYPEFVRNLPEVDVPIDGVRGWLLEDGKRQVVFFDIQPVAKVPPHFHCEQWGIMLDGEMDLTINGKTTRVGKGDTYFIPEGAEHSATFLSRVNVIDMFDAPDRYHRKQDS